MADTTSISWTDATVNFWWGCTKVGLAEAVRHRKIDVTIPSSIDLNTHHHVREASSDSKGPPMPDRLPCCVPFCRRTRGPRKSDPVPFAQMLAEGWWHICGDHWRLVDPAAKAADRRLQRLIRKADAQGRALPRIRAAADRAGAAIRAQAIERAMGITA